MAITLSYGERKAGWWVEEKALLPCAVSKDGQLIKLMKEDALGFMMSHYPHGHRDGAIRVWYFNDAKDREIAEMIGDEIFANPRVLWDHLLPR